MTQEDKELLLKDLCARLPYKVIVETRYNLYEGYGKEKRIVGENIRDGLLFGMGDMENVIISFDDYNWESFSPESIKPYLRPMSSMTREEEKEYAKIVVKSQDCSLENNESATTMVNDWYLSKGFDVRGLIPKGLALEAPKGMYIK